MRSLRCAQGRVAIIPSLTENSPYTVMECAHLRVPLLASRVGGIPELLDSASAERYTFLPEPLMLAQTLADVLLDGIAPAALANDPDETRRMWLQWHERAAEPIVHNSESSRCDNARARKRLLLLTARAIRHPAASDDTLLSILIVVEYTSGDESPDAALKALVKRSHDTVAAQLPGKHQAEISVVLADRSPTSTAARDAVARLQADAVFRAASVQVVSGAPKSRVGKCVASGV